MSKLRVYRCEIHTEYLTGSHMAYGRDIREALKALRRHLKNRPIADHIISVTVTLTDLEPQV